MWSRSCRRAWAPNLVVGGPMRLTFPKFKVTWTIGRKLPVLMVAIAALSCGTVAFYAASTSFSTTQDLTGKHLEYVAGTKREILETKLAASQSEIASLANSPGFLQLFDNLSLGFGGLSKDDANALARGPRTSKELVKLQVGNAQYYVESFREADPWLQSLVEKNGFTCIGLVDEKGRLIYSTTSHVLGSIDEKDALREPLKLAQNQTKLVSTAFSAPTADEAGMAYFAVAVFSPPPTRTRRNPDRWNQYQGARRNRARC